MKGLDLQDALARDVLNALSANIAVLDAQGTIVAVNDAWIRFARANDAKDEGCYVGSDYLAICEEALQQTDDDELQQTVGGLRAMLEGASRQFSIEYPCHSPAEQRWFHLRATRLQDAARPGIVVAHEDITQRKRAEQILAATERELRSAKEEMERAGRELVLALERERELSRVDGVTGAINRRHFFELAEHELSVTARYRRPLSLMLFDIDHFKQANDTRGHHAGDELLKRAARVVQEHLRISDIFARYGGDEFVVLLPHATSSEAAVVAERMRTAIADESAMTISIGIAGFRHGDTLDALIHRADEALYRAKNEGRNRFAIA
ncbi:MAG TPA: diguanylate cyclase [Thermoanaerobaculia bacterium]|nr:diguanylate cyclase [Thermoanaerobaculia bacterium]